MKTSKRGSAGQLTNVLTENKMAHWNMESCAKINCILVVFNFFLAILGGISNVKFHDVLLMSQFTNLY